MPRVDVIEELSCWPKVRLTLPFPAVLPSPLPGTGGRKLVEN